MAKTEKTNKPKKFVGKVSSYSTGGRKHIEVPKTRRHLFEPGDVVRMKR
jgi:hypothetical protein